MYVNAEKVKGPVVVHSEANCVPLNGFKITKEQKFSGEHGRRFVVILSVRLQFTVFRSALSARHSIAEFTQDRCHCTEMQVFMFLCI